MRKVVGSLGKVARGVAVMDGKERTFVSLQVPGAKFDPVILGKYGVPNCPVQWPSECALSWSEENAGSPPTNDSLSFALVMNG